MQETYRTLPTEHEHEIPRIKGSRFIARAAPVENPEAADTMLHQVRGLYPDARHHCFAYRVGIDGAVFRFSDDGEPGGSAGRPILQQIDGRDLVNAMVVVTRYFGGTKLGVGGLIRAYSAAAGEALSGAGVHTVTRCAIVRVAFPYALSSAVQAVVAAHAFTPTDKEYGESVCLAFSVPLGRVEAFVADIVGKTAAKAEVTVEKPAE